METEKVKECLQEAYTHYCDAMKYYEAHEVEGALINFLLAYNIITTVNKLAGVSHIDSTSSACKLDRDIDNAKKRLLRYIVPLQEQLSRIKTERSGFKTTEQDVPCIDVKNYIFTQDDQIVFDNISGQETAKGQLINSVLNPLIYPRLFPLLSKGILFYGAPGTGKTLLAKAFVNEFQKRLGVQQQQTGIFLYTPKGGDLKGKYVGDTEKNISKYFRCASERASKCDTKDRKYISVIFIDEIDSIAMSREGDTSGITSSAVNTLLQEMDGIQSTPNVVVMGATNYPWRLDDAILRRFDSKIMVGMPTAADVAEQIKIEIARYIRKVLKAPTAAAPEESALPPPQDAEPEKNVCDDYQKYTGMKNTPQSVFKTYRDEYFPEFTDEVIMRTATQLLKAGKYSGGDIANICKHAFKVMGQEALNGGRFKSTVLPAPGAGENVKCADGSDYTFNLFSLTEGRFAPRSGQAGEEKLMLAVDIEGDAPTYNTVMTNIANYILEKYYINATNARYVNVEQYKRLYNIYKQLQSQFPACKGMYVLIDDIMQTPDAGVRIILDFKLTRVYPVQVTDGDTGTFDRDGESSFLFFSSIQNDSQRTWLPSWFSSWYYDKVAGIFRNINRVYNSKLKKYYASSYEQLQNEIESGILQSHPADTDTALNAMTISDITMGEVSAPDTCEPVAKTYITFDFKSELFTAATGKSADCIRPSTTQEKIAQLVKYSQDGTVPK